MAGLESGNWHDQHGFHGAGEAVRTLMPVAEGQERWQDNLWLALSNTDEETSGMSDKEGE